METTQCYVITSAALEAERRRVGGQAERVDFSRILTLTERVLPPLGPHDVRLKILATSGEHNVVHALLANTIDIVAVHGGTLYPGNSAIGEITEIGGEVKGLSIGDLVQTHCNGEPDAHGYPLRIWAYDAPASIGWYCKEAVVADWQVIRVSLDCGLTLWELAALPLRAPTAYHLWRRAVAIYRAKVSEERQARLDVLAFGGGVSELFLMLAQSVGHRAYFCSGNEARRAALAQRGIIPIEQPNRFATDADVQRFRETCKELTAGRGMHVVCDMLRGRVFEAGLRVAARQGVNVSAGWQLEKNLQYDSAGLAVKQLTLDHVHYDTIPGCSAATALYGSVFKPLLHKETYSFEDLPRCLQEMHAATQTGIPVIRVASELPAAVRQLV